MNKANHTLSIRGTGSGYSTTVLLDGRSQAVVEVSVLVDMARTTVTLVYPSVGLDLDFEEVVINREGGKDA